MERSNFELLGIVLCFLATLSISLATILIKDISSEKFLFIICTQMLIGFLTIKPISFFSETWEINLDKIFIFSLLFLIIGPGIIANFLWLKMISNIGAAKASSFHFLNPILGLFAAYIFLFEKILLLNFVSVILISLGIICIQFKKHN